MTQEHQEESESSFALFQGTVQAIWKYTKATMESSPPILDPERSPTELGEPITHRVTFRIQS